ncbi:MAG: glycosyltransferase family 4 protein [Vicinamibacterales bacterium]
MRLLYLTPTAAMGGAERVLLDLLTQLRRVRPDWPIRLIIGNDGPLAADAERLGIDTVCLPFPRDFARLGDAGLTSPGTWMQFARYAVRGSVTTVRYLRTLRRMIATFAPDVVHSNGIKMHLLAAVARPTGSALVWHFHDYPSARPVTRRLVRTLRRRPTIIVAVSKSVAADIRQTTGDGVHVETVWNAVDLERFDPCGPQLDLDALAGLPPAPAGTVRLGLVATFARWKGHRLFLDMVRALGRDIPFRAYIVGGPVYETNASQWSIDALKASVAERDLSDRVGLTGFVADTSAALRALDIVVHASTKPEPFGLAIAEAMAAARAVVISDAGGVAELVVKESTGLTYRCGSVEELTSRVRRLLEDGEARARLGRAAHVAAVRQFDPQRVTTQMLDVYERCAERRL